MYSLVFFLLLFQYEISHTALSLIDTSNQTVLKFYFVIAALMGGGAEPPGKNIYSFSIMGLIFIVALLI